MLQSLFDIYVDYIFSLFHFKPSYSFKTLFIRSRPTFLMLVTIVKFYKFYKAGFFEGSFSGRGINSSRRKSNINIILHYY